MHFLITEPTNCWFEKVYTHLFRRLGGGREGGRGLCLFVWGEMVVHGHDHDSSLGGGQRRCDDVYLMWVPLRTRISSSRRSPPTTSTKGPSALLCRCCAALLCFTTHEPRTQEKRQREECQDLDECAQSFAVGRCARPALVGRGL